MPFDWFLLIFSFVEEKQRVRKAILKCSLPGANKEAFEDESDSEEDEDD